MAFHRSITTNSRHARSGSLRRAISRRPKVPLDAPSRGGRKPVAANGQQTWCRQCCSSRAQSGGLVTPEQVPDAKDKRRYANRITLGVIAEKARLSGMFLDRKEAECQALQTEIDRRREEEVEARGRRGDGRWSAC